MKLATLLIACTSLLFTSLAFGGENNDPSLHVTLIEFKSIGAGIDYSAYSAILSKIGSALSDGKVVAFYDQMAEVPMEGERSICIRSRTVSDAIELVNSIEKISSRITTFSYPSTCPGNIK